MSRVHYAFIIAACVLLGIFVYQLNALFNKKQTNTFEECLRDGGVYFETVPGHCEINGKIFSQPPVDLKNIPR